MQALELITPEKPGAKTSEPRGQKPSEAGPAPVGLAAWRSRILRRIRLLFRPFPNPSGLVPGGHALLLVPYEPDFDKARASGLIIPDWARAQSCMVEMRAIVVAMGEMAYREDNASVLKRAFTPWRPRCLPGDKIMIQQYSGAVTVGPLDGRQYRMINDEDVFTRIVAEAQKPLYPH